MVEEKVVGFVRIGLRGFAALCAIVVFAVIADKLQITVSPFDYCAYGLSIPTDTSSSSFGDTRACNYGIGVGVLALIAAIALIIFDVLTAVLSVGGGSLAKIAAIVDVIASSLLSLLWVVGFIYLAKTWNDSDTSLVLFIDETAARASIAFCFFSSAIWIALTVMAVLHLRKSSTSDPAAV